PLVIPLVAGRTGCVCASWCKSTFHVNALAGSTPCSGSVAVPLKLIVSPAAKVVPAVGAVIVAVGGWLNVTVKVAAAVVMLPSEFVTRTRKSAPSSAGVFGAVTYVADVAPAMSENPLAPALLRCHW